MKLATPRLNGLADFPQSYRRNGPGEDVVKGVVGIGMPAEKIAAGFDLRHNGVGRRRCPRGQGQGAGEINVGGYAPESGGAAGGFRRLGEYPGIPAGPVVRHRDVDVGMGFDAAGEDNHSGGVDAFRRADVVQGAGGGQRRDPLAHDAHVHRRCALGRYNRAIADNRVQHSRPPVVILMPGSLF